MDLTNHVETLRAELLATAAAAGAEDLALIERLLGALDPAVQLVLLDVVTATAAEITAELAPGSVDVRLRGREPEFVVTPPPAPLGSTPSTGPVAAPVAGDTEEGGTSRLTLRMPEQLKARVEDAAGEAGVSVNSWLVRAVTDAVARGGGAAPVDHGDRRAERGGGQRFTGWVR